MMKGEERKEFLKEYKMSLISGSILTISPADIFPFFRSCRISLRTGSESALKVSANAIVYVFLLSDGI